MVAEPGRVESTSLAEGINRFKRKNKAKMLRRRLNKKEGGGGMEVVQAEEKPKSGAAVVGPTEEELRDMESMWG